MSRALIVPNGTKFNKFTVISEANPEFEKTTGKMIRFFNVRCSCPSKTVKRVRLAYLRNGTTVSCGCFHKENQRIRHTKHGLHKHFLYNIHKGMIRRCTVKEDKDYNNYGGRGITVCKEWYSNDRYKGLINFIKWNDNLPAENQFRQGLQIERVNNNGNYDPNNCVWATRLEQSKNKRSTMRFKYKNKKYTFEEMYTNFGNTDVSIETAYHRYHIKKWKILEAVTLPKYAKPSCRRNQ